MGYTRSDDSTLCLHGLPVSESSVAAIDEQRAVMGENYWSYNITDNVRSLEAMMTFAHQFGLTREKLDYEDFFHLEAAALEGV